MAVQDYLKDLGYVVRDRVSKFEGVAVSVSFDLFGCVQVDVRPQGTDKDGKLPPGYWFDHKRLERASSMPVMDVPNFETADVPKYQVGRERGGVDHASTQRA